MRTIAILAIRLGALEHSFKILDTFKLKRERKQEFQRIVRVLKGLRLVEDGAEVFGVSLGVDSAGELTAFVTLESPSRAPWPFPTESKP